MNWKVKTFSIFISMIGLGGCVQPPAYQPQPIAYNNFSHSYATAQPTVQSNPFLNVSNTTAQLPEGNATGNIYNTNSSTVGGFAVQANKYATQIQGISSYEHCGITAVMVLIKNQTRQPLYIDFGQFSASNGVSEYAPYPPSDVATLIMNSEGFNQALNGAVSGTVAGAAGGALLGGIVMSALGGNFADGAKWGAVGGATGGMAGGAVAYKQQLAQAVASEIESKKLTPRSIYPNASLMGVLYFPAGLSTLNIYLPDQTVHLNIQ
jgi:hypothetical protein